MEERTLFHRFNFFNLCQAKIVPYQKLTQISSSHFFHSPKPSTMKRLSSPNSLVPLCPNGFQTILDGLDDDGDDSSGATHGMACDVTEKKRRLSGDQVRALEKNFEVDNKLEPERKVRLAHELGLQPRQVAVWFQNRRARWKTKQLERDYGALKSRYDSLRLDYDSVLRDKDSLLAEVKDLKAKLGGEESFSSIKEEPLASESENKATAVEEETLPMIYSKDGAGSSDSDSSAVVNDENSPLISSSTLNSATVGLGFNLETSSFGREYLYNQQQQLLKVEEGEFLNGDEPCSSSFFADEQPPTLSWYCGAGWD